MSGRAALTEALALAKRAAQQAHIATVVAEMVAKHGCTGRRKGESRRDYQRRLVGLPPADETPDVTP